MAIIKLSEDQKKLIERLGVYLEKSGSAPVEGRILALLMVSDETNLAFDDIYETLGISKSAASNTLNILLTTNKIDYITKPGDRKRYFCARMEKWQSDFSKSLQSSLAINDILKEILAIRPEATKDFNQSLKELIDFMEYLKIELPVLLENWQQKRA